MNLTTTSSQALPAAIPATGPVALAPRWMWAALGALGASVVALAAVVVVQSRSEAPAGAPSVARAVPAVEEILDEKSTPALSQKAQVAPQLIARNGPGGAPLAPRQPAGMAPAQAGLPDRMAPLDRTAGATPVTDRVARPVCAVCGHVESVQAVQQAAPATGVGAVAGGVLGAVVGNQIGRGNGRTAATVLGAVGGGYAGHQIEKNTRTRTVYETVVRMDDGSARRFQRTDAVAVGTPVTLQGKGFRVGAPAPAAPQDGAEYSQPGMVRTGG